MTVIAAGGTTWTRCLGHAVPSNEDFCGQPKLETLSSLYCPLGRDTWIHSSPHWQPLTLILGQPVGRWEEHHFFPREPSLPQLLGPPAPQLHYGDLVKGDQCQKKGAVDPPIPYPMATGQLAIRLVYIDLPFPAWGRGYFPVLHLPPPLHGGKGIKNHLYAHGDSFLIRGFSGGLGGVGKCLCRGCKSQMQ